jgi:FliI/YscN family ATPase
MRGAYVATAVAEYFRDQGADVILMMDSATRYAYASREVGLSIGEPATTRGYTPSVFSQLPLLLERAGAWTDSGSITGLYTVLVEGDDMNEPVADAMRAILDGHIVLKRELAARNHYPAIDVLSSVSRLMIDIVERDHLTLAGKVKDLMATYARSEDMINIGAYVKGSNPGIDKAIEAAPKIESFLKQPFDQSVSIDESRKLLAKLGV